MPQAKYSAWEMKTAQEVNSFFKDFLHDIGNQNTDVEVALQQKIDKGMVRKANEVTHTTNTGFGKELIPVDVLTSTFIDLIPQSTSFMSDISLGYHGNNMNKTQKVPVLGELPFFKLTPEWTGGTLASQFITPDTKLPTDEVMIQQYKYTATVGLSDEEVQYSIVDVLANVNRKLALSAGETIQAMIINGDTETATGNINNDEVAPSADQYYLGGNGLRKTALASATTSFDAGTLAWDDYLQMVTLLGDNASDPSMLLFLANTQTYLKSLGLSEFKDQSMNGRFSTIAGAPAITPIGVKLYTNRKFAKTKANGKVSTTPANNVKGGLLCLHKSAVQWWSARDLQFEIVRAPSQGWNVVASFYFGYAIATGKAGQTDPTISHAYNITL